MAGCVAGSAIVFTLARRLGARFAISLFDPEKSAHFAFLRDSRKVSLIVFVLFLIPGAPKDMLSYLAGLSRIGMAQFLVLSNLARAPSVISSVIIGATLWKGDWKISVVMFGVTAAIGVLGIFYKDKVVAFCRNLSHRKERADDESGQTADSDPAAGTEPPAAAEPGAGKPTGSD
jgi:uncharacterized membrane protein YdjX (TVP38/TMEM64 family)